ncbi:hypothetical protein DY000_02015215 [Brassica cretica]|uniref:Uncharacterized protein n=1 Tax=Brassica cretica TaxID=69181 RepID=A0ABQ7CZ22_BRACR|nr:hypothetical protein DY000_02015215 [Brassica cretica]
MWAVETLLSFGGTPGRLLDLYTPSSVSLVRLSLVSLSSRLSLTSFIISLYLLICCLEYCLLRLHLGAPPSAWSASLSWLPIASQDSHVSLALLQGWQSSFYCIWQERNSRLHRCLSCPASMVAAKIISLCVDKCSYMSTLGSSLGPHLCGYLVPQSIVRGIQLFAMLLYSLLISSLIFPSL